MPGGAKYSNYPDTLGASPYGTDGGKGVSDKTLLQRLFPVPPGLKKDEVAATANAKLCPDVQDNPDPMIYTEDDVKLGFGAAPEIEKGPFNGQDTAAGGPADAHYPNLTSPDPSGGGSTNPIVPTKLTHEEVNKTAKFGVDGLVDPAVSSKEMSNATKITGSPLPVGKHPGSK